jgi:outer membrane protein OmpA-like peptidoglycan-associated protein
VIPTEPFESLPLDEPPPRTSPALRASRAGQFGMYAGGALTFALTLALSAHVLAGVTSAKKRLFQSAADGSATVAIADHSEVPYCTPAFKEVFERVLHSCGLTEGGARRGCKPSDLKTFASISDDDFNALFTPLRERGGVLLFDNADEELDASAKAVLEERFLDRRGARYFFVVARASKTGSTERNQALSHRRANSVLFHLKTLESDPDLEKRVGLLWLGNEFGQLSKEYCDWPNSRPGEACSTESVNRSTFVSWVDCRL